MNKKILFGLAALAISTITSAMAADMAPAYKAAPVAPAFSWTGCYVGGNGGGGRGLNDWQRLPQIDLTFNSVHNSGWLAGVQAGCDYQVGSLVVGIEGQYDWANMKDTTGTIDPSILIAYYFTSKLNRIGTLTGRVGYAFDRILLYAKGGAAFAHFNHQLLATDAASSTNIYNGSQNIAGFVVGGGVEYALLPNLSLKAEYNYFDLGRNGISMYCTVGVCAGAPVGLPLEIRQTMQTVMLGVNYRFELGSAFGHW